MSHSLTKNIGAPPRSVAAMVALRERETQYGITVNLPQDHTATSVTAAVAINAFAVLPPSLKRTSIWDQGPEMASEEAWTEVTGVPVFFAQRSSPWQRAANEHLNGPVRQYFPPRHQPGRSQRLARPPRDARTQQPTRKEPRLRHPSSTVLDRTRRIDHEHGGASKYWDNDPNFIQLLRPSIESAGPTPDSFAGGAYRLRELPNDGILINATEASVLAGYTPSDGWIRRGEMVFLLAPGGTVGSRG